MDVLTWLVNVAVESEVVRWVISSQVALTVAVITWSLMLRGFVTTSYALLGLSLPVVGVPFEQWLMLPVLPVYLMVFAQMIAVAYHTMFVRTLREPDYLDDEFDDESDDEFADDDSVAC